jgi:tetratricopeptide (TPR) repeat protein
MNDDVQRMLSDILDILRKEKPEYLLPDARVTVDFIRDVIREWDMAIDSMITEYGIVGHEADEILQKLSADNINNPMNVETIRLITEHYDEILYHRFLAAEANSECFEPWQYNNRANSRSSLDRPLEALEDYNRACELDPECAMYRLNRAGIFLELGMHKLAQRDALETHAVLTSRLKNEFGSTNDFTNLNDYIFLAKIFSSCGQNDMAAVCLLSFVKVFKKYQPFLSKLDAVGCVSMLLDGHSSRLYINSSLKEAMELLRSEQIEKGCDDRTTALLEDLRKEFQCLERGIKGDTTNNSIEK